MLLVILTAHLAGERLGAPDATRLREGLPGPQVAAGRDASAQPASALSP
jgi:hypothetical protein